MNTYRLDNDGWRDVQCRQVSGCRHWTMWRRETGELVDAAGPWVGQIISQCQDEEGRK